jgi:hypothetical protein
VHVSFIWRNTCFDKKSVKDEIGDQLANFRIFNGWKNYFSQLLSVRVSMMVDGETRIQLSHWYLILVVSSLEFLLTS